MKKKNILMFVALIEMAMQIVAQENLVIPQFTKALKVLSKGVNIRQAPSTQSAKIGSGPEVFLVIDETDEWYHACILKNGWTLSKPGYVSKKACKVKELPSLDANYIKNAWNGAELSLTTRKKGKYKGYSIISYYIYEIFSPGGGDDVKVPTNHVNDGEGNPNWSKLTDNEIDKIMLIGDDVLMVAGTIVHDFRDGESESGDGVVTYSFDKSDYQGPKHIEE